MPRTLSFQNKRGRQAVEEEEEEDDSGNSNTNTNEHSSYQATMDLAGLQLKDSRPIKPLKGSRRTQSDSVLTFGVQTPAAAPVHRLAPPVEEEEEEDWSLPATDSNTQSPGASSGFTPLSFQWFYQRPEYDAIHPWVASSRRSASLNASSTRFRCAANT